MLRWPRDRRMPFRRFFLNTRILGPRLSPSTTATTLAPETNGVPATMSPPSVATKSTLVTDTSSPALAAKWSTSTVVPGVTFSCRPPLWIIAYTTRLLRSSYPDPDLWAGTKYSVYHADRSVSPWVHGPMDYFMRIREPLIFWLLRVLRKLGTSRSMSSKYEDSAGVACCGL